MPRSFKLLTLVLAGAAGLGLGILPARASDPLSGLTPVTPTTLNSVNVQGNFFNTNEISNTASQSNNVVSARNGSQIVNGAIQNNAVSNNSGLTAVLMNTGNNVNFNNAMVVNIIVPH